MTTYTFSCTFDLHKFGTTEDGDAYLAEIYYIVAEDALGNRFAHNKVFEGCECEDGEDWTIFNNVSEEAQEKVAALLATIQQAPPTELDSRYWRETYPAYGSAAYSDKDALAWEMSREQQF